MITDKERAYNALSAKSAPYTQLFNYYDGDQPLMYASKRLNEIFAGLDTVFVENWCAVVIDALKDRVNMAAVKTDSENIAEFVKNSQIIIESDDVHEAAMVAGESFYIVWPDVTGIPEGYYNDPRLCHVFYQSEKPRIKEFACKWWVGESDGLRYLTLYYPDRLEYYRSTKTHDKITSGKALFPLDPIQGDNPYGTIPVFHFRLESRKIISDIKNAIPLQNGVNKLLTDMMVTAEFGAFPQRYVITDADIEGKLKNAPGEIWGIPAGDGVGQGSSAGQFAPANLDIYLRGIDSLSQSIATITRTPRHYFISTGGDPSGEALITMESPLTKKAQDRIDRFIPVWQHIMSFAAEIAGETIASNEILIKFDRPETIQPRVQAEIREINLRAGIPLEITLRDEGKTDAEIEAVMDAKRREDAAAQVALGQVLLDARRDFDQGGG